MVDLILPAVCVSGAYKVFKLFDTFISRTFHVKVSPSSSVVFVALHVVTFTPPADGIL